MLPQQWILINLFDTTRAISVHLSSCEKPPLGEICHPGDGNNPFEYGHPHTKWESSWRHHRGFFVNININIIIIIIFQCCNDLPLHSRKLTACPWIKKVGRWNCLWGALFAYFHRQTVSFWEDFLPIAIFRTWTPPLLLNRKEKDRAGVCRIRASFKIRRRSFLFTSFVIEIQHIYRLQ